MTMFGATAMNFPTVEKTAVLSDDGRYRYVLSRSWGSGVPMVFVMLNPSTADAEKDDATIRKCVGFARRFAYGGIVVVNLFALRSKDPKALAGAADPVGPDNDGWIKAECEVPERPIIVAWGANGRDYPERVRRVLDLIAPKAVNALRVMDDGTPWHPLMLPYRCTPNAWSAR